MEDPNNQIQNWLVSVRQAGLSNEQIQAELLKSGWTLEQVQNLLQTPREAVQKEIQASQTLPENIVDLAKGAQKGFSPSGTKPKTSHKTLVVVLSVIVGTLILGGVAFAGWKGYIPIPFIGNNSEKILNQAIKGFGNIQNAEVGVNFRVAAEAKDPRYQSLPSEKMHNLNSKSGFSLNTFNNLPPDLLIDGRLTLSAKSNQITDAKNLLDDGSGIMTLSGSYTGNGQKYSLDSELRYTQKKLYLILRQIPAVPFVDLSAFKGQWFSLDATNAEQNYGLNLEDTTKGLPNQQETEKLKTEIGILAKHAIKTKALALKKVGTEKINGQDTQRINILIKRDNFSEMVRTYRADASNRKVSVIQIENLLNELNTPLTSEEWVASDYVKEISLNLWLNKSDSSPRKIELSLVVVPINPSNDIREKQFRITLSLALDHINEQPTVDIPQNAKPIEEIIAPLLEGPRSKARDAQRKSDVGQIRTGLALYFDEYSKYPAALDELANDKNRFMSKLPTPPTAEEKYIYILNADKTNYTVCATLENEENSSLNYCLNKLGPITSTTPTQP
ncbi:MAG: hypothetical protein WC270_03830 [Patescibacteria group bacterium]|jgi:hypothetical protein